MSEIKCYFDHCQMVLISPDAWPESDSRTDQLARGQVGFIQSCMDDRFPFDDTEVSKLWEVVVPGIGTVFPVTEELIFIS